MANQRRDYVTGALCGPRASILFGIIMKTSRFIAAGVRNNGNEVNGPPRVLSDKTLAFISG